MFWEWVRKIFFFILFTVLLLFIGRIIYNFYNYGDIRGFKYVQKQKLKEEIPEFKKNPEFLEGWKKHVFVLGEIREWLKVVKPNESDFANWIVMVKSEQFSDLQTKLNYQEPLWLKNNVDIEELRKEYLNSEKK